MYNFETFLFSASVPEAGRPDSMDKGRSRLGQQDFRNGTSFAPLSPSLSPFYFVE
jgi:hypothetical protein